MKKKTFKKIIELCPVRIVIMSISLLLILIHVKTRDNYALNRTLSIKLIRPLHYALASFNDMFPFSAAEVIIAAAIIAVLVWFAANIIRLIRDGSKLVILCKMLITILTAALSVYAGFCMLWGVYYYGDDFVATSGLECGDISVEQLKLVTKYFADMAGEYSALVPRNKDGTCGSDRKQLLEKSADLYSSVVRKYECLSGPNVHAKGVKCSKIMSMTDFTGFFFPFTAEANVNMDFPQGLLASTIAHELAHQRGVAKEQEANFVAVMSSLESGDPEYIYSAALLAYTHLGNALSTVDREDWQRIYASLDDAVKLDLTAGREYWALYKTPIRTVSNTVYEGFLKSYDQSLGLKSYGACVDLLVNYYYDEAAK